MLSLINRILDWFKSLFWKEEMELTLVGLQCSGKTTFVNVIAVSNQPLIINSFNLCVLFNKDYTLKDSRSHNNFIVHQKIYKPFLARPNPVSYFRLLLWTVKGYACYKI